MRLLSYLMQHVSTNVCHLQATKIIKGVALNCIIYLPILINNE